MIRKSKRQIFYVCSAIKNENLISETLPAFSMEEAGKVFNDQFGIMPKTILGPFLKKRTAPLKPETTIKFDGKPRQAMYEGWLVNAFELKTPENSAFLLFIKRLDNQKKPIPKGKVIVPTHELRFI